MRHDATRRGGGLSAALVGLVLGAALQLRQPELWTWDVYALVVVAALLLIAAGRLMAAHRGRVLVPLLRVAAVLTTATLLSFALVGLRCVAFAADALSPTLESRDVQVTGVVAAMPQRSELGLRLRFQVESARAGDDAVPLPPQILLGWYANGAGDAGVAFEPQRGIPDVRAGERWKMTVRLKAPHGTINPLGFDYELWLWEQDLQATGYVRAGPKDPLPRRLDVTWQHPIERVRQSVRDAVMTQVTDRKLAGIIAALVVGDQAAIDRADWDVFRATGVAHLMSISGLHVTMFAWLASLIVGALWRRSAALCRRWPAQHAALAGGVLLASAYAAFSGWGVPSQRTIWMLGTVGLLRMSARRWPWPQVWLLACAVVVTIDPWALMQAGFWLSFVAVGVLFASDAGRAPSSAEEPPGRAARVKAALKSSFREQWVVTIALTPLTLLLFGQVSVVGLVANAFAIPWVTLVVTPLAMAGVASSTLWIAAAWAVQVLAAGLEFLASFPFATVSSTTPPVWAAAAGVLGGLLLAMRLPFSVRVLGVPLLLPALLWQPVRPAGGQFELLAADIGQGNAVIVRTAAHTLVFDAGPRYSAESDAGHRVLVPLLRANDEKVDVLMISHRDIDHTGGAAAILAMQPDAQLHSSIELRHELQALRLVRRCIAGQHWDWDGVAFDVLQPYEADYLATAKSNAMSCVLRVTNGVHTALLGGDIEAPQESRLVADIEPARLHADVLLVPHHGSKTSSTPAFLDAVHPTFGLVQAGYRNRFGHPAPPVVARYVERGITVVDSPHCGAALWRSWDAQRVTCQREVDRRYWQHRPGP